VVLAEKRFLLWPQRQVQPCRWLDRQYKRERLRVLQIWLPPLLLLLKPLLLLPLLVRFLLLLKLLLFLVLFLLLFLLLFLVLFLGLMLLGLE
jgi:hypothetical protein